MSSQPEVRNIFEQVKTARVDPVVGIRIVKVTGDDSVGLYVAELGVHSRITAHYHRAGGEIYQLLNGEGTLHTGIPLSGEGVAWNRPLKVQKRGLFYRKGGTSPPAGKYRFITDDDNDSLPGCPPGA